MPTRGPTRRKSGGEADATAGSHKLTHADMVLVALYRASGGKTNRAPYEELVLQAWRDFPEVFGLRNYADQHPDASDVHKRLYSTLKPAGLVVALGNKEFRLTDKGLERAARLVAAVDRVEPAGDGESGRLARDQENFIKHALSSRALARWRGGECEKLIDYDARLFFQFTTATPAAERGRRVAFAREAIGRARDYGIGGAAELAGLADHLVERFGGLLQEG